MYPIAKYSMSDSKLANRVQTYLSHFDHLLFVLTVHSHVG
jgi:hypothetical protein